jgi:3-isopropylmalate/(R)-2-methylmalate dehydratase small subunit
MLPEIKGKVAWVFPQPHFDVDLIIGLNNISIKDIETLKNLCMKEYDPDFGEYVQKGDVIVGGKNFGYGHPHKGGPQSIKAHGISAIIAESFSPGFYRAESCDGFPLIECPGIVDSVERGDMISYDWDSNELTNLTKNITLKCNKISQKNKDLIDCGGILEYVRRKRLVQK